MYYVRSKLLSFSRIVHGFPFSRPSLGVFQAAPAPLNPKPQISQFCFKGLLSTAIYHTVLDPRDSVTMKIWTSATLAAFALASCTTALVRPSARALQRRTDAPPLPPCPSNNYKPYTYVGCFEEGSPRALQYNPDLSTSTMTVETCTATCKVSSRPLYSALHTIC